MAKSAWWQFHRKLCDPKKFPCNKTATWNSNEAPSKAQLKFSTQCALETLLQRGQSPRLQPVFILHHVAEVASPFAGVTALGLGTLRATWIQFMCPNFS